MLSPVFVRGRDGLEIRSHDLRDRDQLRGVLFIGRAQLLANFGVGLNRLDGEPREFDRQRQSFVGRLGDKGRNGLL